MGELLQAQVGRLPTKVGVLDVVARALGAHGRTGRGPCLSSQSMKALVSGISALKYVSHSTVCDSYQKSSREPKMNVMRSRRSSVFRCEKSSDLHN